MQTLHQALRRLRDQSTGRQTGKESDQCNCKLREGNAVLWDAEEADDSACGSKGGGAPRRTAQTFPRGRIGYAKT